MSTTSGYLEDIYDVDAGWKHSLALDVNDMVWSWGWNSEGQLGVGEGVTYSTVPVQVLSGEQDQGNPSSLLQYIIAISAGRSGEHSLAVDANNFAYAWGYDEYGQCGNGDAVERELTPIRVLRGQQPDDPYNPDTNLTRIVAVSAGQTHSMALEKDDPNDPNCDGRVYTFGSNTWPIEYGDYPAGYGKLGIGTDDPCMPTPVAVHSGQQHPNDPNLKHIVAISAGWDHCMALEKDDPCDPNLNGRVYTWGSNGPGWGNEQNPNSVGGRLGDGTIGDSNSSSTPVLVLRGEQQPQDPNNPDPNLTRIVAVSAGEGHSMALDEDGYVYAWGDNYFGQLGNDTNDPCTSPVKVVGRDLDNNGSHEPNEGCLEDIVAIAAGFWHCLAIDSNGVVWTWGKGADGRLAKANNTDNSGIPHPIGVVFNETQHTFQFAIENAIDDANNNDVLTACELTKKIQNGQHFSLI